MHSTPRETAPKVDRANIMTRAWVIFRKTYKYTQIKFASIGRPCFAAYLRQAWAGAKEAARIAAMPVPEKAARIVAMQDTIQFASFGESWAQARHEIGAARAELACLSA